MANKANLSSCIKFTDAKEFLTLNKIQQTKINLEKIIQAYKEYAQSPYINDYLRSGINLPPKAKEIVDALNLAINQNTVSGQFIRGLSASRQNRLETIDDVAKFIFENKGFTSAVPKANADYANCFALGKNGVKVVFNIKDMPAYKACPYEVLFKPNAFTRDKFCISQIGERTYQVSHLNS